MDGLKQALGMEWEIMPAGGNTGDAYVAEKHNKRLFLKRNSSPFLAVLSAEGIVPKLIWTKRMENGDVITAQEWLEGRELKSAEMRLPEVAELLSKIHQSQELLHMLMRLGKKPVTTDDSFGHICSCLPSSEITEFPDVKRAIMLLEKLLPLTRNQKQVVCHGDLNHNNLLRSTKGYLYLVDWDNAVIADPAQDYSMILKEYIPMEEWQNWLEDCGVAEDENLPARISWYLLYETLAAFCLRRDKSDEAGMQELLGELRTLNSRINEFILT